MKTVAPAMLFLMLSPLFAQQDRETAKIRGDWSSKTVSLFNTWGGFDSNPGRRFIFFSPDKKKKVEVTGDKVWLFVGSKKFDAHLQDKTNAELGWSPDSTRFFLTWTDGGSTGSWHVQVYEVSDHGLTELKGIENEARKDFEARIRELPPYKGRDSNVWATQEYCEASVVGSEWLARSSQLLVSVLVPPTSACRYMTKFDVYRIDIPSGKILQRYTAREAHRKFNSADLPKIGLLETD